MIIKRLNFLFNSQSAIHRSQGVIRCLVTLSPRFKPVTHVIFDMDGLLIDSETIYFETFKAIAAEYGKTYDERLMEKHIGMPANMGCGLIIKELHLPLTVPQMMDKYAEMVHGKLSNCPLLPGALKLVTHLKNNNVPIAVATSSHDPGFTLKTKPHKEFFDMFHHIVSVGIHKDVVKRGKPFPDVFLVCASWFKDKPKPEKCLVLEDSPNGVKAGLDAGMQVVMVPFPKISSYLTKQATLVLKSLEDFKPEEFGLPPF